MKTAKQCSCGSIDFELEIDDQVVKICCKGCDTVYFPDEITDLPDTDTD